MYCVSMFLCCLQLKSCHWFCEPYFIKVIFPFFSQLKWVFSRTQWMDQAAGQGHLITWGIIRAWSPVHCVTWWCMRGWPLAHGELPPHSHDLVTRGFLKQRHRVNYDHEGWEGESGDQWITDHKGQLMGPGAHIESVIVNLRASVRASVSPST